MRKKKLLILPIRIVASKSRISISLLLLPHSLKQTKMARPE
ncbi:MAG: hypothetical protein ACQEP5_00600 [Actinomycetota bacterium]